MSAWFRPKRFGFGASPSSWQGWLATAVFIAALPLSRLALRALLAPVDANVAWRIFIPLATLGFVVLVWCKTDGAWAWRWGNGSRD